MHLNKKKDENNTSKLINTKSIKRLNPLNIDIPKNRNRKIIFYTVCGEGLGHAIRSSVIINGIKELYDVYIFASDRAYTYLNEKFDNVYEIGGIKAVHKNNKVSYTKSMFKSIKNNPHNIKKGYETLYKMGKQIKPNIIVTDLEKYGSILSKLLDIPLISIDNIHVITQTKIDYPPNHKISRLKLKAFMKKNIIKPKFYILSNFFYPKIRDKKRAVLYPPVLREDILKIKPTIEDHIVVYQTTHTNLKLVKKLKKLDENFIIYGFNKEEVDGNLQFRKFSEKRLYEDLSSSKAVIANGGSTFISESLYLKKPTFSIPIRGQFEQLLNGFYVKKLGYGQYNERFNLSKIDKFLNNLDKYQKRLDSIKKTDNKGIINELIYRIEKYSE